MPAALLSFARSAGSFLVRTISSSVQSGARNAVSSIGSGVSGFFNSRTSSDEQAQQAPTISSSTFLGPVNSLIRLLGIEPGLVYALAGVLIVPFVIIFLLFNQVIVGPTALTSGFQ